ncbi:hypothetical protein AALP_AAs66082U000100 [Arabis alpina]|uniref:Uncharacterized protein n=1 Tax=Arabis alpina TaxID=50452 RepID=A0A087G2Q2_ARAAL|nr:hypothetical protein AALP_AAs66082U000100 [Arabis alpina]
MAASCGNNRVLGSYVKRIACGGRHSTDTGALLTFGWGLYGQVSTTDPWLSVLNICLKLECDSCFRLYVVLAIECQGKIIIIVLNYCFLYIYIKT